MRPPGPDPGISLMSTPISRARRLTDGDAGATDPRAVRGAGDWGGGGSARGAADRPSAGSGRRIESTLWSGAAGFSDGWVLAGAGASAAGASAAAGAAAPAPFPAAPSTVSTTAPTFTFSPFLTLISLITPATDDGTSIV